MPWSVYEAYGDPAVIETQWTSMPTWSSGSRARRAPTMVLVPSAQFGDWLDPDAPPNRPWEAKVDSELLANAFFVESARLAAAAAHLLGDDGTGRGSMPSPARSLT